MYVILYVCAIFIFHFSQLSFIDVLKFECYRDNSKTINLTCYYYIYNTYIIFIKNIYIKYAGILLRQR